MNLEMETSWTNFCRCCLSSDCEVSLFDAEQNVEEKFRDITTIEVKADDGLPQKLCAACYGLLISAYEFRTQCVKMDSELKLQLAELLNQVKEKNIDEYGQLSITYDKSDDEDIANDPVKQLEALIKQEPSDSDDDCYYVLVIDDKDSKEQDHEEIIQPQPVKSQTINSQSFNSQAINSQTINSQTINSQAIKSQAIKSQTIKVEVKEEMTKQIEEPQRSENHFSESMEQFLMSNTRVPANVPATILENEEDSQEVDYEGMNIDETCDSMSQEQNMPDESENQVVYTDMTGDVNNSKNLIKILTAAGAEGTIVLKSDDGIQYLTDTHLVTNEDDEDADPMSQEVILCEGDDSSQFQILKYDGSELVIEYADDGQIATVLQQDDGTFLCDCGEQFEDLAEYEKHQYKHNPAGEHLCNLCGKGFESGEILAGHMLLHSVTGVLITCPFCNQLIRRSALTQHIKYGHNNIKPCCSICSKTFANPNNLKRHMMIHSGIREFECDICFKRFSQKITMQTHRLTHMNPFSCHHCDQTFENKNELTNHKESGECSKSKVLKVKEELMKTVKQEVTTNLGKVLGYACSLCKKMFSVESALEQHVETTHIVDPTELLCSECGEVLPSKKDMQMHVLSHKNLKAKNAKRFECSICGKGCASQAMLLMHERVHTNERPFPCHLCSLRFKTRTHLRTHQLTHTREKKFGCSVCMKFFALKGNLVVHLRTHTGERPYVCSLCGEAFIDSKYLKKHKLKKHAIENLPWNQY